MAVQELEPQPGQPEQDVQVRPEQVDIPREVEADTGAQATAVTPQPATDASGQIYAQPVPAPADPSGKPPITISDFQDEEQVKQYTHGDSNDSITWHARNIIRLIQKKALVGIGVIFGKQNKPQQ